jgi:hypothetical protein
MHGESRTYPCRESGAGVSSGSLVAERMLAVVRSVSQNTARRHTIGSLANARLISQYSTLLVGLHVGKCRPVAARQNRSRLAGEGTSNREQLNFLTAPVNLRVLARKSRPENRRML